MLSSRPISVFNDDVHANSTQYYRKNDSKTPGRTLKGRTGLQENAFKNGSISVNPKEKRVVLQSPFRKGSGKIILQDAPTSMKPTAVQNPRPLGDKTPAPNRQNISLFSPGPRNGKKETIKFTLPVLLDVDEAFDTSFGAPSSVRKIQRAPQLSKTFETPKTKGDHWNVSDLSIDLSTANTVDEPDPNELDYSDPEYVPPRPVEPNFEMPFELPDYKEIGESLQTLAQSYTIGDSSNVVHFDMDDLLKGCDWSYSLKSMSLEMTLNDDEDDIFGSQKVDKTPGVSPTPRMTLRSATKNLRSTQNLVASHPDTTNTRSICASSYSRKLDSHPVRPATSTSMRPPDERPVSYISRPGTSLSNTRDHGTYSIQKITSGGRSRTRSSSSMTGGRSCSRGPCQNENATDFLLEKLNSEIEDDCIEDFRFAI